ncbi:MAG TPA: right-handed parallel beta-helix repeat-containing protein [Terriglobales bacterium]|nr:right-handed parallel beta-helix repeat-containing protein [Terriglobales bacterium]
MPRQLAIIPALFAATAAASLLIAPLVPSAATAAIRTVTNGNDSGSGSLRQTIAEAADGDTIAFSGVSTVTLTTAELTLSKNLVIDGGTSGVTITRASASQFRIVHVFAGVTATLRALTVTGGSHPSQAGGIQSSGTLAIDRCTITGNSSGQAGGVQNDATITLTNTTISGNEGGGGLVNFGSSATLTNVTIADNAGGGILQYAGAVLLSNSIVAGNAAANVSGSLDPASAYNLIGAGGSGGLSDGVNNNRVGVVTTGLAALGSYGGPTPTHALLPGSVALDNGTSNGAPAIDQRGSARAQQGSVDIGAFESAGFSLSVSGGNSQTTGTLTSFAEPLRVAVSASALEPVDGGYIIFTPPASGAGCTLAGNPSLITGGVASSGSVSANATSGSYSVSADAAGTIAPVSFSLSNTPNSYTPPSITAQSLTRASGAAAIRSVIATVGDAYVGGLSVSATAVPAGVAISNIVNDNGTVSADVEANCAAGTGEQSIELTVANDATGLSSTAQLILTIIPNTPHHLAFGVAPSETLAGTAMSPAVTVRIEDQCNNLTGSTASVSLQLWSNPTAAVLTGGDAVAAAGGLASFPAVSVDRSGLGYTLRARTTNAPFLTLQSNGFNITCDQTHVVTTHADSGVGSLRQAIADSCIGGGDTIVFDAAVTGTLVLASALNVDRALTVSGPGADLLSLSGNDVAEVLVMPSTVSGTIAISGLTIERSSGDGVRTSARAPVQLTELAIRDNAGNGVAASGSTSTVTVLRSLVENNGAAGVYATSSSGSELNVVDSVLADNGGVGASACCGWSLRLTRSRVAGNTGGGVYATAGNELTVTDSTIESNGGTGIARTAGGFAVITGSTIANNVAVAAGGDFARATGGIDVCCGGLASISSSTISGNTASVTAGTFGGQAVGGVSVNSGAMMSVRSCTIAANSAQGDESTSVVGGVAKAADVGLLTLGNSIVAANFGGDVSSDVLGPISSVGYNLIGDSTGSTGLVATDLAGTTTSPIDPLLGPLADNGGLTETLALLAGSPAIDAGDHASAPAADQRGIPRNGIADIGAFEFDDISDPHACPPAPMSGCRTGSTQALTVKTGKRPVLKWNLGKLDIATAVTDFGDPVGGGNRYRLCLYDSAAGSAALAFQALLGGGGTLRHQAVLEELGRQGLRVPRQARRQRRHQAFDSAGRGLGQRKAHRPARGSGAAAAGRSRFEVLRRRPGRDGAAE